MKDDLIRKMAKDIIEIELDPKIVEQIAEIYHEIARKHGIKAGDKHENGTAYANPEWTMTRDFFLEAVQSELHWEMLLNVPEDLKHY